MHLGNGVVTPGCAVMGLGAAALGAGVALVMARKAHRPHPWHFAAATALVFAMQTLNVPVAPWVSGHMIGGFLLATWFGSAWGMLGVTLVLGVQSVLFGDGGWMVLGLNVLNMAVIPCLIVYPLLRDWIHRSQGAGKWLSIAVGSWASVVVASIVCSVELVSWPGARAEAAHLLALMFGVHALIGVLEAGLTVLAIAAAASVSHWSDSARAIGTSALAMAAAFVGVLGASPWPDGLEYSLERRGLAERLVGGGTQWMVWPGYEPWWSALVGCVVVLSLAVGMVRVVRQQQSRRPIAVERSAR